MLHSNQPHRRLTFSHHFRAYDGLNSGITMQERPKANVEQVASKERGGILADCPNETIISQQVASKEARVLLSLQVCNTTNDPVVSLRKQRSLGLYFSP